MEPLSVLHNNAVVVVSRDSENNISIKFHEIPEKREQIPTGVMYGSKMTEHRRNPWDPNCSENPQLYTPITAWCNELGLLKRCERITPRLASDDELISLAIFDAFSKRCQTDEQGENLESLYDSVYFNENTSEVARLACGGTIDLVKRVAEGKLRNGMAIISPPKHNSLKDEVSRNYHFSNVAVATKEVLGTAKLMKRILIVDFHPRHGHGIQQAFYEDPSVLYFSTHRHDGKNWPNLKEANYNWIGTGDGKGFNCNIPLNQVGMGNTEFLTVWHQVLIPIAYQFKPDLVIVSAGFDAELICREGEGEMKMYPQCYPHLIRPLMGLANGKLVVILEEDSNGSKVLAEAAALTLRTLLGDPCPIIPPISSPLKEITSTILNSHAKLRKHWDFGKASLFLRKEEFEREWFIGNAHFPTLQTFDGKTSKLTQNCDPILSLNLDKQFYQLCCNTSLAVAKYRVGFIYEEIVLGHQKDENYPENPNRAFKVFSSNDANEIVARCHRIEFRPATHDELRLLYTEFTEEEHIAKMQKTTLLSSYTSIRLGKSKPPVISYKSTYYEFALHAAGSVIQAVDSVMAGECQSVVAIVPPPGQPTDKEVPSDVCVLNNVGLAAKYALEAHKLTKILILDWGLHHGSDIQHMFEEDPRVLYISLHRFDLGHFDPSNRDAYFDSVGLGAGKGFNVNIPWINFNMTDTEYLAAFTKVILPISYEFSPELVLVSAGFDANKDNRIIGGYKVTPEGYGHMTNLLMPLANGRIILALEGGYNLKSSASSMAVCTSVLLGDPVPPISIKKYIALPAQDSIRKVLAVHSKHWTVLAPFQKYLPRDIAGDCENNLSIKFHEIPEKREKIPEIQRKDTTGVMYGSKMTEHRRNPWDSNCSENPQLYTSITAWCNELGLLKRCERITPRLVSDDELISVAIFDAFSKRCQTDEQGENLESLYDSVYFNENTSEVARLACGGTIDLVKSVAEGKLQNGMAIISPPKHNSLKDEVSRNYHFNNVAVATKEVLGTGKLIKRILIVDFHPRHGHGIQQAFYGDPSVLYFSTHRHDGKNWPNLKEANYNWIGTGDGKGFNCNIPLNQVGMGSTEFLTVWHQVLIPIAYQFKPDLVIVSAGFDAELICQEGEMKMYPQCYPHLIRPLMGLANGKLVVILEEDNNGSKALAEAAALTLRTLLGDPCPIIPPISLPLKEITSTILDSHAMLRRYWDFGRASLFLRKEEFEREWFIGNAHFPTLQTFDGNTSKPTQNSDSILSLNLDKQFYQLCCNTSLAVAKYRVGFIYEEAMLGHQKDENYPKNPNRAFKVQGGFSSNAANEIVARCHRIEFRPATHDELRLLYTKFTEEEHIAKMQKTTLLSSYTMIRLGKCKPPVISYKSTYYEFALHAAGSVIQAVDSVMAGECQSVVAIVPPPGQPTDKEVPSDICVLNNVGLAAKYALETHKLTKILILDWGLHHGSDIQHMFEEDPRVLYISLHRFDLGHFDQGDFFPSNRDAYFDSVGLGAGEGFNVNIPWINHNMTDTEYLAAFTKVILPISYEFSPELVLVSAGFDASKDNRIGGYKVTPEGYGHMTNLLMPLANGRIILALEGGYNLKSSANSMAMCTSVLLGDTVPPISIKKYKALSAQDSIRKVLAVHSKYWTVLAPFQKYLPRDIAGDCDIPSGFY